MEITLNGPSVCAGRAPLVIVFFPGSSLYEQAALAQHQISPASHNRLQRPKRSRIALVLVPDFPPATAQKSVEGWNYQARMVTKPFEASVGGNHLPDFQSSKPCPSEAAGFRQNKRATSLHSMLGWNTKQNKGHGGQDSGKHRSPDNQGKADVLCLGAGGCECTTKACLGCQATGPGAGRNIS